MENVFVFCDFDGTITQNEISIFVLDKLTKGKWRHGKVSIREGSAGSLYIYKRSEKFLKYNPQIENDVVKFAKIERGFEKFYELCQKIGLNFIIVSDGFEFYIRKILSSIGIKEAEVFSSQLLRDGKFRFPNSVDFCRLCATCKFELVRRKKNEGFVIYIGNGISDRCASEVADIVFAKKGASLEKLCIQRGISFFRFSDFHDIIKVFSYQPDTFIFDFDGTLAWSLKPILKSFRYALRELGASQPPDEELAKLVGLPLEECFVKLVGKEKAREGVKYFRRMYDKIFLDETESAPQSVETLKAVKSLGFKVAVLSNKSGERTRKLCEKLGFSPYLDIVVGEGDIVKDGKVVFKPDVKTVEFVLEKVGGKKPILVGDSTIDLKTAQNSNSIFAGLMLKDAQFYLSKLSDVALLARFFKIVNEKIYEISEISRISKH